MYQKSLTSRMNIVLKEYRLHDAVGVRGRGVSPVAIDTGEDRPK